MMPTEEDDDDVVVVLSGKASKLKKYSQYSYTLCSAFYSNTLLHFVACGHTNLLCLFGIYAIVLQAQRVRRTQLKKFQYIFIFSVTTVCRCVS